MPCKSRYNTCKFQAFWGARAAGNAQKLEFGEMVDFRGIPAILVSFTKKHPELRFGGIPPRNALFGAQEP